MMQFQPTDHSKQPQAIVIGQPADGFVRHATSLLGDYEIAFTACKDVYQAVALLA